jgi:MtN3 and saliva related transmembrane protein
MDAQVVVNAVGTAAGLCSMSSFVPQLIKIAREKRAEGVSLRTYMVTVTGFILWIIYGVLLKSWPVAASNSVCLILAGGILALRWRYGEQGRDSAPHPKNP